MSGSEASAIEASTGQESFLIPGYLGKTLRERWHNLLWRILAPLPDAHYCALKYRVIKGRFPRLRNPRTFTEKLQARKLYDRNPLYPVLVDKHACKDWVAERIGPAHVIPTQWVGQDLAEVDWDMIQLPVVAKPTHASGVGKLLYTREDVAALLKDNPSAAWLAIDHARYNREWAYRGVPAQIIVETMLQDHGRIPWDYRLVTFNGKVAHIEVDIREGGQGYNASYTPDWTKLELEDSDYLPLYPGDVPRPPRLAEMVALAERLAEGIDFVRVDLYASADWVYVGEMTLYPGGGFEQVEPPEYDLALGEKWRLGFSPPR